MNHSDPKNLPSKLFDPSRPLCKATVQEIQLELIRRTEVEAFHGERIVATLLDHRDLWQAVMLDRIGVSRPGKLPAMGLIKLNCLEHNLWNADTLYILTPTETAARQLVAHAEEDRWGGMVLVHTDRNDVDGAIGGPGVTDQAIISIWWD